MKQFVECCLLPSAICWPHKNTAGVHMNMMASQVSLGLHKHFLLICDVSEETRNLSDLIKYMLWNKASVFYFFPSLLTRQIKTNTTLVRQVFISNFKKKKKIRNAVGNLNTVKSRNMRTSSFDFSSTDILNGFITDSECGNVDMSCFFKTIWSKWATSWLKSRG